MNHNLKIHIYPWNIRLFLQPIVTKETYSIPQRARSPSVSTPRVTAGTTQLKILILRILTSKAFSNEDNLPVYPTSHTTLRLLWTNQQH